MVGGGTRKLHKGACRWEPAVLHIGVSHTSSETRAGLIGDAPATAHPGFSGALSNQEAVQQRVVRSGTVITSRGPGTTLEFALRLVAELYDEKKALDVAGPMVVAAGWEKALE